VRLNKATLSGQSAPAARYRGGRRWLVVIALGNSIGLFVALAAALVVCGLGNAAAVAGSAWFKPTQPEPKSALPRYLDSGPSAPCAAGPDRRCQVHFSGATKLELSLTTSDRRG
jgi:hypothetical protein